MSENNIDPSWLDMYLYESTALIEKLEFIILTCEKESTFDKDNIDEIFRVMHTIKGSSSMMSYINIANVAHSLEDLFYFIRENSTIQVDYSILCDFVLFGIDFIKVEVNKIKDGQTADGDASELIGQIEGYINSLRTYDVDLFTYQGIIHFTEGCEMEDVRAYSIIHNKPEGIRQLITVPNDLLGDSSSISQIREHGFEMTFQSCHSYEFLYEWLMNSSFVSKITLSLVEDEPNQTPIETITDNTHNELQSDSTRYKKNRIDSERNQLKKEIDSNTNTKTSNMISVSVEKIDRLLDLIGEMVIAEDMVIQNSDLDGLKLDNFKKASNQLKKITSDIQEIVMEIRMVPLEATFLKMNRIVRDVSKKLGKDINLQIIGEDTEVDKKIIELISDPIMHLVRNGLDHGIESKEERIAKGKTPVGNLILKARNEGSDVIIQITDDGKGLDKESILKKAMDQGIITSRDNMTDKEIHHLILIPGFSTKEEVTEYSGRGVGMDVVAKNIEDIGGTLSIESEEGKGSTITLKIPLTLAIIDGMNIKVGESRYTIPTISIKETFQPTGEEIIKDADGHDMIMVRGKCYLIHKLHEMFQVETFVTSYTEGIVVMVEQEDRMAAIFADNLIGQQQVVVKTLPEYIKLFQKKESILAGCTLLGDGSISLILDISKIINLSH